MNFQFFDYQEKLHFDFYIPIPVGVSLFGDKFSRCIFLFVFLKR